MSAVDRFNLSIPFNRPFATGAEFGYIREAIDGLQLSGNGRFTARCRAWLEERTGASSTLLTPSCTAALELAALLVGVGAGDEVIMPSFTFSSTATPFALRGATPVFVDIRADTLNLDEEAVAAAVTERTRAIVPIHYAGVPAELDPLRAAADAVGAVLIEDAAHALGSTYRGRPVGADGRLAALSFHETKNLTCGEGGALLINDAALAERAEIMQEKGTDRARLFRGEVDKYTWVDIGSSFLLSEINSAFLWAQCEAADEIFRRRFVIWDAYHEAFAPLEAEGLVRRPVVPDHCTHSAHLYYLLLPDEGRRDAFIASLRADGIAAIFHYLPLHSSRAGLQYGRADAPLPVTDDISGRLVRLPLWVGMGPDEVSRVVESATAAVR